MNTSQHHRALTGARAWVQAARLPSQLYIALPLLFGQLLWAAQGGSLSLGVLVGVQLFGVLDQLYIVFANDYADRHTDPYNTTATPFSGGSRVLVEGKLPPRALLRAAQACGVALLATAAALAAVTQQLLLVPLGAAALLLLWLYSYPPARLSYRGGGELLQMLGVGAVLPAVGWVAQGGDLTQFPLTWLAVLLPTQWANAVATSLPDEPSDRAHHKRTAAVMLGGGGATVAMFVAYTFGLVAFALLHVGAWVYALVPMVANGVQLGLMGAQPGTRKMLAQVFFAVLASISWWVGAILYLW